MATNIKSRDIQINLNFFWESEDYNINPSGWVLLKSEFENQENSRVKIPYYNTSTKELLNVEWDIPEFFKQTFDYKKYGNYVPEDYNLFSRTYIPEECNLNYSSYIELYSQDAIESTVLRDSDQNEFTIKHLIEYSSKIYPARDSDQNGKKYLNNDYLIQTEEDKKNFTYHHSAQLNILDQTLVQSFKISVLKNLPELSIPCKEQILENNQIYKGTSLIWKYTIAPYMPYGILESKAVSGEIDLMMIGEEKHTIDEFKYYNSGVQGLIRMKMTSYNSDARTLEKIKFDFYDVWGKVCDMELPEMVSYNGNLLINVPLDGNILSTMHADKSYPNHIDTEKVSKDSVFLGKYLNLAKATYIDDLQSLIKTSNSPVENKLNFWHDPNIKEGLLQNWLYYIKIYFKYSDSTDYEDSPEECYYYWTNTKFNEYFYNTDPEHPNYNNRPFDVNFSVSTNIVGKNIYSEYNNISDTETIYKEKTIENNPFQVQVLVNLENNYRTLFLNTKRPNSYLKELNYGVSGINGDLDNVNQVWDTSQITSIGIDDSESQKTAITEWLLNHKKQNSRITSVTYPSTIDGTGNATINAHSWVLQDADTEADMYLTLDENFQYNMLYSYNMQEKQISAYEVIQKDIPKKDYYSCYYHWHGNDQTQHGRGYGLLDRHYKFPTNTICHINGQAPSEGGSTTDWAANSSWLPYNIKESGAFILKTDTKYVSSEVAAFMNEYDKYANTNINNIFTNNMLSYVSFKGYMGTGDFWQNPLDEYGFYIEPGHRKDWKDGLYAVLPELHGPNARHYSEFLNKPQYGYLVYRNGNSVVPFRPDDDLEEFYDDGALQLYCINKQQTITITTAIPVNYNQNLGILVNKQNLVIQAIPQEFPDIYLGYVNIKNWYKELNTPQYPCISITTSAPREALYVLELNLKIKYLERSLEESLWAYDNYNDECFQVKDNQYLYIRNKDKIKKFLKGVYSGGTIDLSKMFQSSNIKGSLGAQMFLTAINAVQYVNKEVKKNKGRQIKTIEAGITTICPIEINSMYEVD